MWPQRADRRPRVQDVVDTHPGLAFLKEAADFHSRYITTVSISPTASWAPGASRGTRVLARMRDAGPCSGGRAKGLRAAVSDGHRAGGLRTARRPSLHSWRGAGARGTCHRPCLLPGSRPQRPAWGRSSVGHSSVRGAHAPVPKSPCSPSIVRWALTGPGTQQTAWPSPALGPQSGAQPGTWVLLLSPDIHPHTRPTRSVLLWAARRLPWALAGSTQRPLTHRVHM